MMSAREPLLVMQRVALVGSVPLLLPATMAS